MDNKKRIINLLMGPGLFALIVFALGSSGVTELNAAKGIGVGTWMIYWWVTRPVDITVTALLPVALNALFNMVPMDSVISQYASGSIILIFGSCLLTAPWSEIGLDKRISLKALSLIGPSMKSQITVWLLAAVVMSNMMPNVVVVAIFTPIAVSMLAAAGYKDIKKCEVATPILCAIAWGSQVGGAGTPLGGAMNITAISFIEDYTGKEFMYVDWITRMLPYTIIATAVVLVVMLLKPLETNSLSGTKEYFEKCYEELGPMKKDEKISLVLFIAAMLGSFIRPLYAELLPGLVPAYLFLILGFLNFVIVSAEKKEMLLTWDKAQKEVMWGMLLLFAGGLALGQILVGSGANESIATLISKANLSGGLGTIFIFTVFACFISEMTNSTVSAAVTLPIVIGVTTQMGLNPIPYIFTTAMGMNFESLLPVSVRAISVGYGLDPEKLLKNGLVVCGARMVAAVAVGYLTMLIWSGFGVL
ncbi:solute carrier family 13 (sodium-dependent dicarboxylate transporter), member 2/3/5 [Pseudobutyrivibrio sp. YE44]|uniref:SLC13 family permease n=1 Tax=Pseudobutyrivibrio sp. YE44 TaxID=1520802 RepID=UPI00088516CF|nr:SLC13 family permease [Pseudobutyrivibrio sp. YE44]SDB53533.1 solute carrier family 13 (sodium-dependent dicarboxylate transporter), member 2/3/5 [Pseudobutyrivibrio sp. YE44]